MKPSAQAGAIGAATLGTGAAVTAGFAGACCVGPAIAPILLGALGSSGLIALSTLRPFTPLLLLASAALLVFSFRQTYRKQPCADGLVRASLSRGLHVARAIVWLAAALWLAASAYAIYGFINE